MAENPGAERARYDQKRQDWAMAIFGLGSLMGGAGNLISQSRQNRRSNELADIQANLATGQTSESQVMANVAGHPVLGEASSQQMRTQWTPPITQPTEPITDPRVRMGAIGAVQGRQRQQIATQKGAMDIAKGEQDLLKGEREAAADKRKREAGEYVNFANRTIVDALDQGEITRSNVLEVTNRIQRDAPVGAEKEVRELVQHPLETFGMRLEDIQGRRDEVLTNIEKLPSGMRLITKARDSLYGSNFDEMRDALRGVEDYALRSPYIASADKEVVRDAVTATIDNLRPEDPQALEANRDQMDSVMGMLGSRMLGAVMAKKAQQEGEKTGEKTYWWSRHPKPLEERLIALRESLVPVDQRPKKVLPPDWDPETVESNLRQVLMGMTTTPETAFRELVSHLQKDDEYRPGANAIFISQTGFSMGMYLEAKGDEKVRVSLNDMLAFSEALWDLDMEQNPSATDPSYSSER